MWRPFRLHRRETVWETGCFASRINTQPRKDRRYRRRGRHRVLLPVTGRLCAVEGEGQDAGLVAACRGWPRRLSLPGHVFPASTRCVFQARRSEDPKVKPAGRQGQSGDTSLPRRSVFGVVDPTKLNRRSCNTRDERSGQLAQSDSSWKRDMFLWCRDMLLLVADTRNGVLEGSLLFFVPSPATILSELTSTALLVLQPRRRPRVKVKRIC